MDPDPDPGGPKASGSGGSGSGSATLAVGMVTDLGRTVDRFFIGWEREGSGDQRPNLKSLTGG